jgi:hypothetical protein
MNDRPKIFAAVLVGLVIGCWFTMNYVRGQPWYAYPLAAPSASEELADGLLQAYQEAVGGDHASRK